MITCEIEDMDIETLLGLCELKGSKLKLEKQKGIWMVFDAIISVSHEYHGNTIQEALVKLILNEEG